MNRKPLQRLGDFELLVALGIVRLEKQAYGAALAREIEERTDRSVSLGAVYKTLERLEQKRYLDSSVSAPQPERGGRRRKHYHLTASGHRALQLTLNDIDSLRTHPNIAAETV